MVKSYVVSDIGASSALFIAGTDVSYADFAKIEKMNVVLVDQGTGVIVSTPTDTIKVYLNILDAAEMNDAATPFTYLLTSAFEFSRVRRWLYSVYIKNTSGATLKAFIQLSKYLDGDQNFDPNVYIV